MDNGNNEVNHIDKTKNKGLIIDEPATIDTIFNYIYITKEAMLFLIANYFNDKREICEREGVALRVRTMFDEPQDDGSVFVRMSCPFPFCGGFAVGKIDVASDLSPIGFKVKC